LEEKKATTHGVVGPRMCHSFIVSNTQGPFFIFFSSSFLSVQRGIQQVVYRHLYSFRSVEQGATNTTTTTKTSYNTK
jgi:hypothetical protein